MEKTILEVYEDSKKVEGFVNFANPDFYNILDTLKKGNTFNFIIGGRGTGKTYTALSLCYDISLCGCKFLYIRHRGTQTQTIVNKTGNPFKAINTDFQLDIKASYCDKDGIGNFTNGKTGEIIGYASALSISGKLRGFDLSDVDVIVWDEFILAPNEPRLKDELGLLLNLYETVNRNREMKGQKPVIVICLSNATKLNSPILIGLNLMKQIENMLNSGENVYTDRGRSVRLELLKNVPITEKKKQTALYRLTEGTHFYSHAIENEFAYDNFSDIRKIKNLNEYTPYIHFLDLYVYRHKEGNRYYFSNVPFPPKTKAPFINAEGNYKILKTNFMHIYGAYLQGRVIFENYDSKIKYLSAYNLA